ncbi:histidine kinase dimerization/phosphoacceptor domain -containing protein [Chitinophaga sp. YIM B06452]|uniref:tetratricopeptide repeat-containing sensor histidine kinase n=1 Tax=Chitinophaga sp. YIM B06452 TaxID=3082158 RepID=UPI0031FEE84B
MRRRWLSTVFFICLAYAATAQSAADLRKNLAQERNDSARVHLLIGLAHHYLYKPGEIPQDLDSAMYFLLSAETLSTKLGMHDQYDYCGLQKGNLYVERRDIPSAVRTAQLLSPPRHAIVLYNIAFHYLYKPGEFDYDLDSAVLYGRQAMAIAKKHHLEEQYDNACNLVTKAYFEGGKLAGSLSYVSQLEGIPKAEALHMLGYIYFAKPGTAKTDMDTAFLYTRQAIALCRRLGLKEPLERNLWQLARIHCEAKQYTEAGRIIPELSGGRKADVLVRMAGYYLNKSLHDSAYRAAKEALGIYQAAKANDRIIACNSILAALEMKRENTDKQIRGLAGMARYQKLMQLGKEYQSGFPIYDQGKLQVADLYFTEAIAIAERTAQDTCLHNARREKGRTALLMNDVAGGMNIFGEVITELRKRNDKHEEALTWMLIGNTIRRMRHNYSTIINAYLQSATLAAATKDKNLEINATLQYAFQLAEDTQPGQSEKVLLQLQEKYPDAVNPFAHKLHSYLSAIYRSRGNLNLALDHSLKSIRLLEKTGNFTGIHKLYENTGDIYSDLGQPPKSITWYRRALDAAHHNPPDDFDYIVTGKLVEEMVKDGKTKDGLAMLLQLYKQFPPQTYYSKISMHNALATCYNILGQHDLAEQYYLENTYDLGHTRIADKTYADIQYNIGKFYLERGQYPRADYHLKRSLIASVATAKDAHLLLFRADSARGDYLSAISHYQRYKSLNDSIFNTLTSRQIQELQIQYETEKKDQALVLKEKDLLLREQDILLLTRQGMLRETRLEQALLKRRQAEIEAERKDQDLKLKEQNIQLLTKQSQLQQSRLQQERILRKVTYGGVSLLLVIVGLLYYGYQMKRRSNKRLEAQQKEINQQNISLQHLVSEKEWLLKEIHHRVKNNLQIVMSLLNSQSAYLQNDAALNAIRHSQHRVQAISLIHKKLYQSDDVAMIDMPPYIHELTEYLMDCFDASQNIRFDLQVANVKMDVSQAVPLGLILNEAITNSIKYAFPGKRDGAISIRLEKHPDGRTVLTIADNGVGLPPDFDHLQCSSLGMSLMQGLTEDLGGRFNIRNRQGACISIAFDHDDEHPVLAFSTTEQVQA